MSNNKRAKKFVLFVFAFLLCGILYALICQAIGFGIPCIFHTITGLDCPGCGISRMCICLIKGDVYGAWQSNPAILCMLIPGAIVVADISVRYIKEGTLIPHKWANVIIYIMIAVLLIFGVVRNLPFYNV